MERGTKKIWLIDDDPLTNMIHETLLNHFDQSISVRAFSFAGDALNELATGKVIPDLIFLDINMPEIDGWEFLNQFEKMNIDCRLLMVSSSIYDEDIQRAKAYKVVENFVSKPLTLDHLNQIVRKENKIKV